MGQHSARPAGVSLSVAGRGLFTATAAVALLGGGTSMAFAGEASSTGDHESAHAHQSSEHSSEGGESCDIPVVDDTTKAGEATVDAVTGGAAAPVFEAGGQATQPVHDALCPPANTVLGGILGDSSEDEESSESSDESTSSASSEEQSTEGSSAGTGVPMELPIQ